MRGSPAPYFSSVGDRLSGTRAGARFHRPSYSDSSQITKLEQAMTTIRPTDTRPWNSRPHPSRPGRTELTALFACGADSGYSTEGDVLVNQTADGIDLNSIWNQAATAMALYNRERSALASLISYPTTAIGDAIPQQIATENFEEASEFGEPQGMHSNPDALILGYDFKDFDRASRMTWKFLRAASAEQVQASINSALEADNRKVTGTLLRRLFDPVQGLNEHGHRAFGLWNGSDGMAPPPHAGKEFPVSNSHYLASGNAVLDPGDLVDGINQVRSKGFGISATRVSLCCAIRPTPRRSARSEQGSKVAA
ncbi:hypothetical protein [Rhodococcus erythropolis]|uniref:hypothetical protein n=2 Tax=Rhodococcus erythropolis TaxID=1833 RepID=UPI001FD762EA|nr:hypothetical protein [Rhodococcus erythropolis]